MKFSAGTVHNFPRGQCEVDKGGGFYTPAHAHASPWPIQYEVVCVCGGGGGGSTREIRKFWAYHSECFRPTSPSTVHAYTQTELSGMRLHGT